MAYKVIILYQLYMPSYFLGTFTEYPNERMPVIEHPFIIPSNLPAFAAKYPLITEYSPLLY